MSGLENSQLKSFVSRIERVEGEIADLNADKRDIYAEAKAMGFDVKVLKQVVGLRRKDLPAVQESNAILALYLQELGMLDVASGIEGTTPESEGSLTRARARVREEKPPTELQRRYGMGA
jgi:uncharacterized protein (UPF0335 family)